MNILLVFFLYINDYIIVIMDLETQQPLISMYFEKHPTLIMFKHAQ
jgi:hypothetical protein